MVTTTSAARTISSAHGSGDLPADVDSLFGHGGYGSLVDLIGGFGSTGEHLNVVAGEVTHPPGGHLGASGVVDAREEDTGG